MGRPQSTGKQNSTANRSPEDNTECGPVRAPAQGRQREEQAAPPSPQKKQQQRGERGGRENSPQPPNRPLTRPEAAKPPPHEGTKDRTPKEAQGDHPAKTGNTKPGTAAHREKGHRDVQRHTTKKKKSQQPSLKGRGWGDRDHKAGDRDTEKQKRKKHTPTTQRRRAGHSRDPGPARTPTPHGGGQPGRARNHTRPISRPKPNPNHEHHKQPTLEGQHHKPCPNTPTQDPSQDWRG